MIDQEKTVSGPWYKEFWAWFVFTPLIVVIIACSITVTMAFKYKDSVVKDDYYKIGKMINSEFKSDQEAKRFGLEASLVFDLESNRVLSVLNKTDWATEETLLLFLSHPVDSERDYYLTLKQTNNLTWQSDLPLNLDGRWYVRLAAIDDAGAEHWRLQGEVSLPAKEALVLN